VDRERDGYRLSDDPEWVDLDAVHRYLSEEAYWSPGIPRDVLERAIFHSLTFSLRAPDGAFAGFTRVVTDRATFAYLCDVFVLEPHRGRGLGVWMVQSVLEHPGLQGLRRIELATADAHELYARLGFRELARVERFMAIERSPAELYAPPGSDAKP
jgi:GNAT superfamily N-acetyltransferase